MRGPHRRVHTPGVGRPRREGLLRKWRGGLGGVYLSRSTWPGLIAAGLEMVCRLARYGANHPSCTRCAAAMVNRVSPINNAVWTAVFMRVTSDTKIAQFKALYPGDAYVDWIAWDPYNRNTPWLSFSAMVTPFYDWLTDNGYGGKPFMLAEYGVVEDPANPHREGRLVHRRRSVPDRRGVPEPEGGGQLLRPSGHGGQRQLHHRQQLRIRRALCGSEGCGRRGR